MNRRGFLGSIIGAVASSPFLALLDTDPWQRTILPYRVLFKDTISGLTIQAPGVAEIKKVDEGYCFIVERLTMIRPMRLDSTILLTDNNEMVSVYNFLPMNFACGDSVDCTRTLTVNAPHKSVKELVKMFVDKNRRK
jgi:hypothetical protein